MYPEIMVIPMREELTRAGINETRTAEDVDAALAQPLYPRLPSVSGGVAGVLCRQSGLAFRGTVPGAPAAAIRGGAACSPLCGFAWPAVLPQGDDPLEPPGAPPGPCEESA